MKRRVTDNRMRDNGDSHRAQMMWTFTVAIVMAVVALHHVMSSKSPIQNQYSARSIPEILNYKAGSTLTELTSESADRKPTSGLLTR